MDNYVNIGADKAYMQIYINRHINANMDTYIDIDV